jgi:hypothetical protein
MTRTKQKNNAVNVIWSAYQIASLLPSDPVLAADVTGKAMQIVKQVAQGRGPNDPVLAADVIGMAMQIVNRVAMARSAAGPRGGAKRTRAARPIKRAVVKAKGPHSKRSAA